MPNEPNQPREYDAILGDQNSTPIVAGIWWAAASWAAVFALLLFSRSLRLAVLCCMI